jgi:hypothetical protein
MADLDVAKTFKCGGASTYVRTGICWGANTVKVCKARTNVSISVTLSAYLPDEAKSRAVPSQVVAPSYY